MGVPFRGIYKKPVVHQCEAYDYISNLFTHVSSEVNVQAYMCGILSPHITPSFL